MIRRTTKVDEGRSRGRRSRSTLLAGALVLGHLAGCAGLGAKDDGKPLMIGVVVDENNEPVSYAEVSTTPETMPVVTDKHGNYRILAAVDMAGREQSLKKGTYVLGVLKKGYKYHDSLVDDSARTIEYRGGTFKLPKIVLVRLDIDIEEDDLGARKNATPPGEGPPPKVDY